ncbi:MAG: hypothetical protein MJ168_09455 [Clostridia bacterium]|nr:hypothetical protein [Clostridia bacterium]
MKNSKGEVYVLICVFVLIIAMIFSVILTYSSVITFAKVQKTNTEIVFDSFVANNSIIIYQNIKQGNNATEGIDTNSFNQAVKDFCSLEESHGRYYSRDADGTEKFSMTKPQMGFIENEKLELYVTFTMSIPVRFAGHTVSVADVPIKIKSELTGKI